MNKKKKKIFHLFMGIRDYKVLHNEAPAPLEDTRRMARVTVVGSWILLIFTLKPRIYFGSQSGIIPFLSDDAQHVLGDGLPVVTPKLLRFILRRSPMSLPFCSVHKRCVCLPSRSKPQGPAPPAGQDTASPLGLEHTHIIYIQNPFGQNVGGEKRQNEPVCDH